MYTYEDFKEEPIPVAFQAEFSGLSGTVPYACQVVEKLHTKSGKDLRVLLLQSFIPKGSTQQEGALFLCTLDGRVKRVMKIKDVKDIIVLPIEESVGIINRTKTEVIQVLVRHNTDNGVIVNLINHKFNSSRASVRAISVLNFLWKKSNNTTTDLPLTLLQKGQIKDLRSWRSDKGKQASVVEKMHEWRRENEQSISSLDHSNTLDTTTGNEMDLTYGGERLEHVLNHGKVPINVATAPAQGDVTGNANDANSEIDEVEQALRDLQCAELAD
eukprot:TRINITY_DN4248_c1_g1_i1.p1 TRINITY_DN4248_c1_g1~~TRINITY_DN4248_c1_g1_i1.p1  ORF type:complete len:298 (+),score=53.56 TRINITY_DN4248_c1_g1_i1:79-894(+)